MVAFINFGPRLKDDMRRQWLSLHEKVGIDLFVNLVVIDVIVDYYLCHPAVLYHSHIIKSPAAYHPWLNQAQIVPIRNYLHLSQVGRIMMVHYALSPMLFRLIDRLVVAKERTNPSNNYSFWQFIFWQFKLVIFKQLIAGVY